MSEGKSRRKRSWGGATGVSDTRGEGDWLIAGCCAGATHDHVLGKRGPLSERFWKEALVETQSAFVAFDLRSAEAEFEGLASTCVNLFTAITSSCCK